MGWKTDLSSIDDVIGIQWFHTQLTAKVASGYALPSTSEFKVETVQ